MADTRVAVVDDHALFRQAMRHLLTGEVGLEPVGEAGDIPQALTMLARAGPDVLLLDYSLGGVSGIDAIPLLLGVQPGMRIIVLTVHGDEQILHRAIRRGAHGFIVKDTQPGQLVEAIHAVAAGEYRVSNHLIGSLFQLLGRSPVVEVQPAASSGPRADGGALPLSASEGNILRCLTRGLSNKEIAQELGLSPNTVRNQLQRLQERLGARNRVQLALLAYYLGLGRSPATS